MPSYLHLFCNCTKFTQKDMDDNNPDNFLEMLKVSLAHWFSLVLQLKLLFLFCVFIILLLNNHSSVEVSA